MEIKEMRTRLGWTQKEFANYFEIPLNTLLNWEQGKRTPPTYLVKLIEDKLVSEQKIEVEK